MAMRCTDDKSDRAAKWFRYWDGVADAGRGLPHGVRPGGRHGDCASTRTKKECADPITLTLVRFAPSTSPAPAGEVFFAAPPPSR
jgi:hypothetical protein